MLGKRGQPEEDRGAVLRHPCRVVAGTQSGWSRRGDEYGKLHSRPYKGAIPDVNGSTGSVYSPLRYASTYREGDLGFYLMGPRHYLPSYGRFTQLDPIPDSAMQLKRYEHAGSNPLNYTDPTGLDHCGFWGGLAAAAAAVGSVAGARTPRCARAT